MTTSDTLEQLLLELAGQTERAQQIWEAEMRADEDSGYDEDDEIEGTLWLTLECSDTYANPARAWWCGFRVQQDEATEWAMYAHGSTPLAAAQALLTLLKE